MKKLKSTLTRLQYMFLSALFFFTAFLNISTAQDSLNVRLISSFDAANPATDVFVSNNYAYLANDVGGLRIINVSDSTNPIEVGFLTTNGTEDVFVRGDIAYLANRYGLRIVDVSDKTAPVELSFVPVGLTVTGRHPSGVFVSGNYAYLAEDFDLRIVDISDSANPVEVSYFTTSGFAHDVFISGNYAFVADENDGLRIIDISNPAAPVEVGYYDTAGSAHRVYVKGNYAYVADRIDGLRIIDITDKTSPTEVGFYDRDSEAFGIFVNDNYAYVTVGNAGSGFAGLRVVDIDDPSNPTETGYYYTPDVVEGIFVVNKLAYAADNWLGMYIFHNDFITGVADNLNIPIEYSLKQNYPNPFNPSTTIKYSIPNAGNENFRSVQLKVYDMLGREVDMLVNKHQKPGFYEVNFDASKLSSGIYFYRLSAGSFFDVKKMLLLK